jgi:adenylate kinase
MIDARIKKPKTTNGFIFDGFPRTVPQAIVLDELMKSHHRKVSGMLCLEVTKDELIKRLSNRSLTSGREDDADLATIERRMKIYDEKTSPIIRYYLDQGKYFLIHGVGTIEEISNRLKDTVQNLKNLLQRH